MKYGLFDSERTSTYGYITYKLYPPCLDVEYLLAVPDFMIIERDNEYMEKKHLAICHEKELTTVWREYKFYGPGEAPMQSLEDWL